VIHNNQASDHDVITVCIEEDELEKGGWIAFCSLLVLQRFYRAQPRGLEEISLSHFAS
jgi:hypothetical protein